MEKKRSVGVMVFGWALIGWGIVSLLLGYFSNMATIHYMGRRGPYPPGIDILVSLINNLPYAFILFAIGRGLLDLRVWARRFVLFILIPLFCILQPIRYFFILGFNNIENIKHVIKVGSWPENMCPMLIPFLFGLFLFYFFTRPKVKEQFK